MAQWQYTTLDAQLDRGVDFDEELRKILRDYGMKGWEVSMFAQFRASTHSAERRRTLARNCANMLTYHTGFATLRTALPVGRTGGLAVG